MIVTLCKYERRDIREAHLKVQVTVDISFQLLRSERFIIALYECPIYIYATTLMHDGKDIDDAMVVVLPPLLLLLLQMIRSVIRIVDMRSNKEKGEANDGLTQ